jgi:hypothetical protein
MALYNNSITAYYDFIFTDLAGKWPHAGRSFAHKTKMLCTSHALDTLYATNATITSLTSVSRNFEVTMNVLWSVNSL